MRQEILLRKTVNKSPNLILGAIEVNHTPKRMPSVSIYIPQLAESSKASFLSNEKVGGLFKPPVTTRQIDQSKWGSGNERGSGKAKKLQQLLEPS